MATLRGRCVWSWCASGLQSGRRAGDGPDPRSPCEFRHSDSAAATVAGRAARPDSDDSRPGSSGCVEHKALPQSSAPAWEQTCLFFSFPKWVSLSFSLPKWVKLFLSLPNVGARHRITVRRQACGPGWAGGAWARPLPPLPYQLRVACHTPLSLISPRPISARMLPPTRPIPTYSRCRHRKPASHKAGCSFSTL